jgi:hypothetical protein
MSSGTVQITPIVARRGADAVEPLPGEVLLFGKTHPAMTQAFNGR